MAHKAMVDGTLVELSGGRALVDSTAYDIKKGRTMIDGTVSEVSFSKTQTVMITSSSVLVDVSVNGTVLPLGTGEYQFETGGTLDILITLDANFGTSTYDYRKVELNGVVVSQKQKTYQFTTDADVIEIQQVSHEQRGGTFGRAFITTS